MAPRLASLKAGLAGVEKAIAAIEGTVRQSVTEPIEQLAVDTHGYTDFAMGLARLLGFDLCPRLKNMRDRTLHLPKEFHVPLSVLPIVKKDEGLNRIEPHFDDLVRIAASIRGGHTSAVLTMHRFGAAARGDPLYRAGVALGQLERSLFLCDVMTNDEFRREMSRVLSHVESFHALQRVIYFGSIRAERGRRKDEMLAISGSLTLLTNLVMAWNTHQMQKIMLQPLTVGTRIDTDHWRHIAQTNHRHINFDGQFEFRIQQAVSRLMPRNSVGRR